MLKITLLSTLIAISTSTIAAPSPTLEPATTPTTPLNATTQYLETFRTPPSAAASSSSPTPSTTNATAPIKSAPTTTPTPDACPPVQKAPACDSASPTPPKSKPTRSANSHTPKQPKQPKQYATSSTAEPAPSKASVPTSFLPSYVVELRAILQTNDVQTAYITINGQSLRVRTGDKTPCGIVTILSLKQIRVGNQLLTLL